MPNLAANPDTPLQLPPKGQVLPGREHRLLPTCLHSQGSSSKPRHTSTEGEHGSAASRFTRTVLREAPVLEDLGCSSPVPFPQPKPSERCEDLSVGITQRSTSGWGEASYLCPKFSIELNITSTNPLHTQHDWPLLLCFILMTIPTSELPITPTNLHFCGQMHKIHRFSGP